jgi:DMSO/TMAO reductase YedYZ molybdopterin-dependent catalytic subunit
MSDDNGNKDLSRRQFLGKAGLLGAAGVLGGVTGRALAEDVLNPPPVNLPTITQPFEPGERPLVQYPEKRSLIRLTTRAVQLETPFDVFNEGALQPEGVLTPNDAFFVRYHNKDHPVQIDGKAFKVRISGNVTTALSYSVADLKAKFPVRNIVAACQCSGNSRGFFDPRMRGGQYANGAMGNARWTGVLLSDVLKKAGVKAGSVQVSFNGLDQGEVDFIKALDIAQTTDPKESVMLAWAMNGKDLPLLNGFPLRLVVPGYYSTYWVKHVNDIRVLTTTLDTYYMTTAYRIPDNACACVPPGTSASSTVPINRMNVRSFITSLKEGVQVVAGNTITVRGIAFDGGSGIKSVSFSDDNGVSWQDAALGPDLGRYSFREWTIPFTPRTVGNYALKVIAVNNNGDTQPLDPLWNPSGYMRNVVETVNVVAV